jgi:large subunit ribosomal protein L9
MAKTEVILTHNIVGLGGESDQVKVAAGYARNYLYPHGFAIPLSNANKRRLEVLKQRRAEREAHELNTMTELSKGLQKLICIVAVKTGEDGKMFGTVTAGMIADQLKHQLDVSLDKRKIHLEHPIRALGDHEVELRLHADVVTKLKVRVESTTPLAVPASEAAPEAREEHPKTEKRGRRGEAPGGEKPEHAAKAGGKGGDRGPRVQRPAKAGGEKPQVAKAPRAEKPSKAE